MKKHARLLLLLCSIAITGLLVLQFYWIKNYYAVNKAGFEKEVNLAFEDAIKKEFSLRCDTITQLIVDKLMDTAEFSITSHVKKDSVTVEYEIANKRNEKDKWSFSLHKFNQPIVGNDTIVKKEVAVRSTETLRHHDLENHIVWYRTQNLGSFMNEKMNQYNFDTARLRTVFTTYLSTRHITVPYQFYLKEYDSTMNQNNFPAALLAKFPVITKSYPTYKLVEDNKFVRAMFVNPTAYIMSKMKFIFTSSVLLMIAVITCITLLFKMWQGEKKAAAIKNDFINNITHEFKTPIATVSAAVEALSDFDVLQNREQTSRYLNHSKNELARLSALVDQLLHISLYENNKVSLKPESINLEESVHAVMQPHLIATGKTIHFSFSNNTGIQNITADKVQFYHAVNNVLDNAVKYSGDPVSIMVDCTVKDNFLVLSVTDNGNGIAPGEIPLVFDKFYRVQPAGNNPVKGYGLGLNYVQNILNRHGGWCLLKSKPGQGSIISLAWPI